MEEHVDIALVRFNKHKFDIFIEACRKNDVSSRDVISTFIDDYIMKTFGTDGSSVKLNTEEAAEEY